MRFALVPTESKKNINKAGQILTQKHTSFDDLNWALNLANQWRACHAYPINTFQATLRTKLINYPGSPIVAQRLKRMPTIIDKLRRYPNMQLTTMQDIGGIRAIMSDIDDVYQLASEYKNKSRFVHELIDEKDYIQNPRSEDGYRSLHLIYKYRNLRNNLYDGLRIELQIRTKLQHTWATAVETMGTLLGQALKSRQGDQEWLDFFAIISSAFAYKERGAPIPRFSNLSFQETANEISTINNKLGALDRMRGFSVAINNIPTRAKGWSYHLIVLNSLEGTVQVQPYDRDSIEQALSDYSVYEKEASEGKNIEPVLVSAGPIDTLRRAYPNFFLDIGDFAESVADIIYSIP